MNARGHTNSVPWMYAIGPKNPLIWTEYSRIHLADFMLVFVRKNPQIHFTESKKIAKYLNDIFFLCKASLTFLDTDLMESGSSMAAGWYC